MSFLPSKLQFVQLGAGQVPGGNDRCPTTYPGVQDASPGVPILVFLSPGVDVAASVEALGRKLGFTADAGRYASVSLGQGQEAIAMQKLEQAHQQGGWVLLQNIHLTMEWTSGPLEKVVDKLATGAHPDFRRVFGQGSSNKYSSQPVMGLCMRGQGPLAVREGKDAAKGVWPQAALTARETLYRRSFFQYSGVRHIMLQTQVEAVGVRILPVSLEKSIVVFLVVGICMQSGCHIQLAACWCRLFLSAEPPPALEKGLPISVLQNCIKLSNEPPEGLKVRVLFEQAAAELDRTLPTAAISKLRFAEPADYLSSRGIDCSQALIHCL